LARRTACGIALLVAPAWSVSAQTNDEARLTLGIAAGFIGSHLLWDIPNQPVASSFDSPDIFHLRREVRSDISISGHATFYRGPHLGFTGEFTYAGLGTSDGCQVVQDGGDPELAAACDALKENLGSASVTLIQGGLVYRPLARAGLQPYFKGLVGLAFTPISTIETRSFYGSIADTSLILTIYTDDSWKELRPTWTAALGVSTAPSSGYQLHVEVRQSWLPLGVVTGPTSGQGFVPPHKTAIKGFTSVLVGFDIVLEKRRGRRY
jgi:opacity protein-like surface antigen